MGNADEKIGAAALEVCDDLLHHGGVRVAVIIVDHKLHALLRADLLQPRLNVFHDLVQGGIVYIVADADAEGLRLRRRSGGSVCRL